MWVAKSSHARNVPCDLVGATCMPYTCILSTAAYCMFSSKFTILGKQIQTCVKSAPEIESHVHNRDDSVSTAAPAKNAGAAAGRAV